MRALLQRVSRASVTVADTKIAEIDAGLLILFCGMQGDTPDIAQKLATKISKMRIFKDADGKMNKSLLDTGGEALIVSQFTLAADLSRGNRPGFSQAAPPAEGEALYHAFVDAIRSYDISVETGQFGADMQVELSNDGPVTLWIDV